MRVVLYTEDLEPITVVELSQLAVDYLRVTGFVSLPVLADAALLSACGAVQIRSVVIKAEWMIRHSKKHMLLTTDDEVAAMKLRSAFLPGQWEAVHAREAVAFARGFLAALERIGR